MAAFNVLDMRKNTLAPTMKSGLFVSVLVPARNEEQQIERCLNSLCSQDYNDYEILVLDDNSTDRTYEIISRFAETHPRVRAFRGEPLPDDWYGKPFALQQLARYAKGDALLFTDADTIHEPQSVSWAATNLQYSGADFISGYAGQVFKTFGERITVPVMFFLTGFVIPTVLNKYIKNGYFSAATGQYIVIRKSVFDKTGGFESCRKKTSEDIYLARRIKNEGYITEFLALSRHVYCRMYDGYKSAVQGISKNIYDFTGKNPPLLILIACAILLFFVLTFPVLVYALVIGSVFLPRLAAVSALTTITWLVIFNGRGIKAHYALLWPLIYANLFIMTLWSFYRTISRKGFLWKGRIVS
jgi:chlorobactene glucosyltransferase